MKKIIAISLICALFISGCGSTILEVSDPDAVEVFLNGNGDRPASDSGPVPSDAVLEEAVPDTLSVTYPVVNTAAPSEVGIPDEALELIAEIIDADVANGFPGAQISVIRHGKLVYERAFGHVNAYLPDGTPNTESPLVTNETLYDLASVTKVFTVNYSLQKMVTDGTVSLNDRISEHLGKRFYEDTLDIVYTGGVSVSPETQKKWKSELTIRDLLCHEGGFAADPRYANPTVDPGTGQKLSEGINILFPGNDGSEETRLNTFDSICRTPLMYKPRTQTLYSDLDYMILGLIVEKVSGKRLDDYIRETFCEPLSLTHITYRPLDHGFTRNDCAATELNGNTRDHLIDFPGVRTDTIQGEVHDEKAYACMAGVSGHAGLFADSSDLAKLAFVMLNGGGYGDQSFFSQEVIDTFTSPKNASEPKWGLGWWRQGNMERTNYFGNYAGPGAFGHEGWTGTLVLIDPVEDLVIVLLTNKINSRITNKKNANRFNGNWYTTAGLGFAPTIIYSCLDITDPDEIHSRLLRIAEELRDEAAGKISSGYSRTHPSRLNLQSKEEVLANFRER